MRRVAGLILSLVVGTVSCFAQDEIVCFNTRCFEPEKTPTIIRDFESENIDDTLVTPNPSISGNFAIRSSDDKLLQDTLVNESKYYENVDQSEAKNKRFFVVPSRGLHNENDPMLEATRPVFPIKFFNKPDNVPVVFPEDED